MKIAWFSPFSKKSAIGLVSKYIVEELSLTHQVDIWVHEDADLIESSANKIFYSTSSFKKENLNGYNAIFYILGDNFVYHGPVYIISQIVPGIVILHDYVMHHFFTGYFFLHLKDSDKYLSDMSHYYGVSGKIIGEDSLLHKCSPIWESNDVIYYPFIEKCVIGARGVFTHSQYVKTKIQSQFLGPIGVQYLPYEPFKKCSSDIEDVSNSDIIHIATLGYVNSNRGHDSIIKVIGSNKNLRQKIKYWIAGPYNPQDPYFIWVSSLIKNFNLEASVIITNYLSDEKLSKIVNNTDLFLNLRIPAMEGGSATLLEEMITGKPVVVADTGVYSEIPSDCVLKIRCNNIETEINSILEKLVLNPTSFRDYGENGKKYVQNNCNIKLYVQSLEKIITEVNDYSPIQKMVDNVGKELSDMEVTTRMDYVINTVSRQMMIMFNIGK